MRLIKGHEQDGEGCFRALLLLAGALICAGVGIGVLLTVLIRMAM